MYRTSEKTSLSRKMAELENRWRKSQEDRYILEVKFKEVLKGLANKNEVNKLLKIREKYNHFLENEDARNERNDRILRTLDKIESQANMLSAKTERLKLLKLHYEAYMKRMYPTWEKDANTGVILVNKDLVYSDSRKHGQSNVGYCARRDEMTTRNDNSTLPYTPRQSEKFYPTSNGLQRELINAPLSEPLPIYHMSNVNPRLSTAENAPLQRLNPEFSRERMYSEEKTTTSHGPTFEQEENTSKDLLNVSLSDDYMSHDGTVPVDTGKGREGKIDAEFQLNTRGTEAELEKVPLYRNTMNGSNISEMPVNNQVENVGSDEIPTSADKMYANAPCDDESPVVGGTIPKPESNVVVTQSTPDIEKSSSEDDMSGRRIVTEDKSGHIVTHENSGPISEAEDIPSESGVDRNEAKEVMGVEQSPRAATSLESKQGNIEEPFMFSSSDADYDELENQMAALVEGKRSDKSQSKPLSQSGYISELRDERVDSGEVGDALGNGGDGQEISTGIVEQEMYQQKDGNDNLSNNDVEYDPDGNNLETVDQMGNLQEPIQSSEEEKAVYGRENLEEPERAELYDAPSNEEVVKEEESVYYARPYEELENSTVNTVQGYDEKYNRQDTVEGDTSGGEGVAPDADGRYYEESRYAAENDSNTSYDKEVVYQGDQHVKSTEGSEDDLGNNAAEVKNTEEARGGGSDHDNDDVDVGFQAEQSVDDGNNFERYTDEPQRDYSIDEPGEVEVGDAQSAGDRGDEGPMQAEHELQEETWGEEEKGEVVSVVQEEYHQTEVTVGANDDYVADQDEAEKTYGREVAEGGDNFEGTANESDDRVHEVVETQEAEDTNQEYVNEGRDEELYERSDEGRESQGEREMPDGHGQDTPEEEKITAREENYPQDVTEPKAGEYEGAADNIVVESGDYQDLSHVQERVLLGVDQERSQHESDVHGEHEMVAETYGQGEEERRNLEENYSHDTIQEVEEPESKQSEHKIVKEDVSENVEPPPKPEPTKEPVVVRQEDHIRQSPQQKELPEGNRERAVGGKTEKTTGGDGRVASSRTNKKEESHVGKAVKGGQREKESNRRDTDHVDKAERSTKEIPQVPSRPLSRQSTRKDGPSPDNYKGEKLKTAIRKFQAKKDTRQPTRRSTDSKK